MQRVEFTKEKTANKIRVTTGAREIRFEQIQSTHPFAFSSAIMLVNSEVTVLFQMYIDQVNQFVMPKAPSQENWIKIRHGDELQISFPEKSNPFLKQLQDAAILYLYYETR